MKRFLAVFLLTFVAFACAQKPIDGVPIPKTVFWNSFNKNDTTWCPVDGAGEQALIYGDRIWDSAAKLSHIFSKNLTGDFTKLDSQIDKALKPGCKTTPMQIMYTFGSVPQWATNCADCADPSPSLPGPVEDGFGGGTRCPDNDYRCLPFKDTNEDGTGSDAIYISMVSQIVSRYKGKGLLWGQWNEADAPQFSCYQGAPVVCGGGDPKTTPGIPQLNRMVRMHWDTMNLVHCLDPGALLIGTGIHVTTALTWFHNFNITTIHAPALVPGKNNYPAGCPNIPAQDVTGKMTYDRVNMHCRGGTNLYPAAGANWNPANFVKVFDNTVAEITQDGLPNPTEIMCDEYGYNTTEDAGITQANYMAYVVQDISYCASYGLVLCGWYQWDSPGVGLSKTEAGNAYNVVVTWLTGAVRTKVCGPTEQNEKIVECGYTKDGVPWLEAWDTTNYSPTSCCTPVDHTFDKSYVTYYDVTNKAHTITNGVVPLSWSPVMLVGTKAPTEKPAPPSSVTATVVGASTSTTAQAATGFVKIASVPTTTYSDSSCPNQTACSYQVTAVTGGGESDPGGCPKSQLCSNGNQAFVAMPSNGTHAVEVAWKASTTAGATYNVYRRVGP